MSKRMKVLVSVLLAILLLTVTGAATVMADDGSTATENVTSTNSFLVRVADKLGITEEELANTFREARQEMSGEAFIRYLDKAVEEGLITQQEANEIKEWWEQKPEGIDCLSPHRFLGETLHNRHMWGAHRGMGEEVLNQADRVRERWQNRLETQNCPLSRARIHQAMRVR